MTTPDPDATIPPATDWRPDASMAMAWNIVGLVITLVGIVVFALPVILGGSTSGSFQVGLGEMLVVVGLTVALMVGHELLHGLVMLGFGARPTFGAMRIGGSLPALYATAPGHRFRRNQYIVVAAAPGVAISVIGFLAGFGPWGGALVLPLAIHLGGCVGDAFIVRRTLREPATTMCEDLRDGTRFHRAGAGTPR